MYFLLGGINKPSELFLKLYLQENMLDKDQFGNKYYKNKKNERWVVYNKQC